MDAEFDPRVRQEGKHLLEYVDVVMRRWQLALAVAIAVASAAAVRTFMTRSVYTASAQVLIGDDTPNVLSFQEITEVSNRQRDFYQTQLQLLKSRGLARRVIESQRLLDAAEYGGPREPQEIEQALASLPGESLVLEGVIDRFVDRLRIAEVKNSQIVVVAFDAFEPALASRVVNDVAEKYIEQNLEFRYQTSAEASSWLGNQIQAQEQRVAALDAELTLLKEREGIVNIEERRRLIDQQLMELGSSLNRLSTQRLEREALYQQMAANARPDELPAVLESSLVQSLRVERARLEIELAEARKRYLEQHPEVRRIEDLLRDVDTRIGGEIRRIISAAENSYRATLAQEASVRAALDEVKREKLELDRHAVEYDARMRELEASRAVLDSLTSRSKQTDVARELNASSIRVVDRAVTPRLPSRPNRPLEVALGVLLGLGLGVGLAFFLDYLDNTIKTPEDVREHLKAPLLAVIAETESQHGGPVLQARPIGVFAEGYRVLRTAVDYSWPDRQPRVLVVTSTCPGEGKTLTSINLALTLASAGARTVLVDADLRKPQVGSMLKLPRRPGLTDVLVGHSALGDTRRKLAGSTLEVVVAGTAAPSPGDLITTPSLERLIETLRSEYQYVVIDSPPVGAVADALILGRSSDGVVVVTGAEMVPRAAARHTLERIAASGSRVLGVVLNRARLGKHSYYSGHYYGHYYGPSPARPEAASGRVASIRGRAAG
jgi:capsular exopolysaccharide synthesis family protein